MPAFHHLDIWVASFTKSQPRWNWILTQLHWQPFQKWPDGQSWKAPDGSYLSIEQSPDLSDTHHDRRRPGMNHVALASTKLITDRIVDQAAEHGWELLFPDLHPYAGGEQHFAAFLTDVDGFEIEIVADDHKLSAKTNHEQGSDISHGDEN